MTATDMLLICGMLAMFCVIFAAYMVKKDKFMLKINKIVSKIDIEKAVPICEELIKSPEIQEFLYSAFMNAAQTKAHVIKPYMDDFYLSMKNKVFSNTGHAGKTRKRAASTICEMTLKQHPLGQAALMFAGDDIKEMIAEDPEQALSIINLLLGNMKNKGQQQTAGQPDSASPNAFLDLVRQQI